MQCTRILTRLCETAKAASVGNCIVCAGMHQSQLQHANCSNADIDKFCGS